jgi:phage recombination protein Bet
MDEAELIEVLDDFYPGAKPASKKLIIKYCKAMKIDPLLKPVHLVPMSVKTGEKDDRGYDIKKTRDVIMPGIGLYRIQAARTGAYAGLSEPEFGPTKELTFDKTVWEEGDKGGRVKRTVSKTISYPEWCKITAFRLVGGNRVGFTALEFWLENVALTKNEMPNEMWTKRAFGQITKCVESQALRKAFPEVGTIPTYDEIEGRELINDAHTEPEAPNIKPPQRKTEALPHEPIEGISTRVPNAEPETVDRAAQARADAVAQGAPLSAQAPKAPASDGKRASAGEIAHIRAKFNGRLDEACKECGLSVTAATIESLTADQFVVLMDKKKEWRL